MAVTESAVKAAEEPPAQIAARGLFLDTHPRAYLN